MKLYYSPGVCSLFPHIVMRELGLSLDLVKVDLSTLKLEDGKSYLDVNPQGGVPALELDNGELIVDCASIIQYLVDLPYATCTSLDADPVSRTLLKDWLSSDLHRRMAPLFYPSTAENIKPGLLADVGERLDLVSRRIEGRLYAMGRQFTAVDAYLFTILRCARFVGIEVDRWPALAAYVGHLGARPAVKAAQLAEGLVA